MVPLLAYGAYSIGDRWYQNFILTRQEESIRVEVMRLREENLRLQRELTRPQRRRHREGGPRAAWPDPPRRHGHSARRAAGRCAGTARPQPAEAAADRA